MKRKLLLAIVMMFSLMTVFSQVRPVQGKITDEAGTPVEGASVQVKGAAGGTFADAQGNFKLNAKTGDILVISATNFAAKEVTVGNQSVFSIVISRQTAVIDEVVVTALGIQRQRKEVGYATAKVNTAELNQARPVGVASGLQGKVSGLNVTTINNGVFSNVKINLRGLRSLTLNNNPMLLLDGVPVDLNYLSSVNPNDISDITILKGSSGAAIYGPDARNGVIVVSTKKGAKGSPVITLSQTTQLEVVSFLPKFQTKFGSGSSVDNFGNGVYDSIENQQYGPRFDGSIVSLGPTLPDGSRQQVVYSADPKQKKKFWNLGVTNQTDISFSAQNFYMSAQDVTIRGVTPSDKNRRTGIRLSSGKEYGRFKSQFNVNYVQSNYDINDQAGMTADFAARGSANPGLSYLVFNTPMHVPLTQYKDWRNDPLASDLYYNEYYPNPYWAIDNYRQKGKTEDLIANLDLSLKATDWLNFTFRPAITVNLAQAKNIKLAATASAYAIAHRGSLYRNRPASTSESQSRSSRLSSEFFATLNKSFGKIKTNLIVGNYWRQTDAKGVNVGAGNLVIPTLFNVGNRAGELSGSETSSRSRLISAYGALTLSYNGWANLELTGRNDWTSVLHPDNNSFFYPGVNVSVVLSDVLDFLKTSRTISYLKLRGSWNKTGNADIAPYALNATYSASGGFPYNVPGVTADNSSPDPLLRPEFIVSKELGLEISFLRNRINLEVAAYQQDNTDQIIPVQTSSSTGYTSTLVNAASFVNKGLEVDLKLTPLFKFRKGAVDMKVNYSLNDSKINSIFPGLNELAIGGFAAASNYAIVGYPAYVFKATDYVRDPQGRVIVDPTTGYPSKDPVLKIFGRTQPKHIIGFSPSVSWNGINLSVVAEYRGGHFAYHGIGPNMDFTGISERSARNDRQRFVFPNSVYYDGTKYVPNTSITVANGGYNFYTADFNSGVATNYLTSANSWRVREVSIGYNVPMTLFGKQNAIKSLTVGLVARNLLIWLPKSNEWTDPDFNFTTGNAAGVNSAAIAPPTRIFGGTITVKF